MYDKLIDEADSLGLIVKEKDLLANQGRIKNNRIAIKKDLTRIEKACVLAEEIGHSLMNIGCILDQNNDNNRKQERKARLWAYNRMITIDKLILARNAGCRNSFEISEFLDVSEEFFLEAMDSYKAIYGTCVQTNNYLITFEPFNIYDFIE